METITIDGMGEHDFRHSIEDMLRLDQVDEAIEKLRGLLEPHAGAGGFLPARFLEVSSSSVEFAGWHKLAERLRGHDRPSFPISAIGVALADARTLGGPGPSGGRLQPFIKTFYFSDDAYPFTEATRADLLEGYSREGFGWQGDYQATDATLSIKGIDDLYGAIVELEDRLFDSADPPEDAIRAGSIGACYLAALIHQALRETIRKNGLPRPLCVLAACDGVYPFFDAPVAGCDECAAADSVPEDVWPNELEGAVPADDDDGDGDGEDDLPGEASLLGALSHLRTKTPVLVLDEADALESARYTEMAGSQRMVVEDELDLKGLLHGLPPAELVDDGAFDPAGDVPEDLVGIELAQPEAPDAGDSPVEEEAAQDPADAWNPFQPPPGPGQLAALTGSTLRARIYQAAPDPAPTLRDRTRAILDWLRRMLLLR